MGYRRTLAILVAAAAIVALVVGAVVARPSADVPTASGPGGPAATVPPRTPGAAWSVPTELFARSTSPGTIVDEASARQVAGEYWRIRRSFVRPIDLEVIAAVETGAAALADAHGCGCAQLGEPTAMTFTAPGGQSYPTRFLAEIHHETTIVATGAVTQDTTMVVFTRQSDTEPWRAAIVTSYGGTRPTIDEWGSVPVPFPMFPLRSALRADDMPRELARSFQSWEDDGRPPVDSPLPDNGAMGEAGRYYAEARARLVGSGATVSMQFRDGVDQDGYYEFMSGPRSVVGCGTVRWAADNRAGRDEPMVQDHDQFNFGRQVPEGSYRDVSLRGLTQTCNVVSDECTCVMGRGLDAVAYEADYEPA